PTTALYSLSLHDALPIYDGTVGAECVDAGTAQRVRCPLDLTVEDVALRRGQPGELDQRGQSLLPRHPRQLELSAVVVRQVQPSRSEEHTSELQSRENLVC